MTDDHTTAQGNPQTPQSNAALARLSVFVGQWQEQASLGGQPIGGGRTMFEWLEGAAFLVVHSDSEQAEFPSSTMIIGADDTIEAYCVLYFNSRSASRVYQMSVRDGV